MLLINCVCFNYFKQGLGPTFDDFFPNVNHRFCVRHLYANFQKIHKGYLKNCFWNASRSTTKKEFYGWMSEIAKVNVNGYNI